MKLHPSYPDVAAVRSHFVDMAEGKLQIGRGKYTKLKHISKDPRVQLVTPTAMIVEQARSQLKPPGTPYKKRKIVKTRKSKSKRRKISSHKDNFSL